MLHGKPVKYYVGPSLWRAPRKIVLVTSPCKLSRRHGKQIFFKAKIVDCAHSLIYLIKLREASYMANRYVTW